MKLEDIIEGLMTGRGINCGCAGCALEELAENTDSKADEELLHIQARMFGTLRENIRNLANSLPDREKSEKEFRNLASKLDDMGYPASANLIRGYIELVDLSIGMYKKTHEEKTEHKAASAAAAAAESTTAG